MKKNANSNDLRVLKTKKLLKDSLVLLLNNKSISNIKVTELCQNAMISKGTFYLHYNDIYDLYRETLQHYLTQFIECVDFWEDFSNDPTQFTLKLLNLNKKKKTVKIPKYLFDIKDAFIGHEFAKMIIQLLIDKIFSFSTLPNTKENSIKLECYFSSFSFITFFQHPESDNELIAPIISQQLFSFFPELYNNL